MPGQEFPVFTGFISVGFNLVHDGVERFRDIGLEFVTGTAGPGKTWAPGPFPRPAPLDSPGLSIFLNIPRPYPHPGLHPAHPPDGLPLKIGGEKRGPIQGMSAGRPRTGAGQ